LPDKDECGHDKIKDDPNLPWNFWKLRPCH
jgi:hypothetical protein